MRILGEDNVTWRTVLFLTLFVAVMAVVWWNLNRIFALLSQWQ